jgi:hypothetical protein
MPPRGLQGYFFDLDVQTLTTLLSAYKTALTQIATAGQSYSISGRTFTRANIAEVSATIRELQQALNRANGTRPTMIYGLAGASYPNSQNSSPSTYPST